MGSVWITFATEDNEDGDIDYLAQEFHRDALRTRLHPMFPAEDEKIDRLMPAFLIRPEQSSAWILYASERALAQGRAGRIASAVEKAKAIRGEFPAIGLFPSPEIASSAGGIPFSHKLFLDDREWRSGLGTALGTTLSGGFHSEGIVPPYVAKLRPNAPEPNRYTFEFRPRMGRWDPVLFAVPPEDKARVSPEIANHPAEEGFSEDAEWYFLRGSTPATPQTSYIVSLRDLPSRLAFGQEGADEVVIMTVRPKD